MGQTVRELKSSPFLEEVIVVDDGSEDGTAKVAAAAGAVVIRFPENRGKAAAMAEGVKYAKSDILLFADADLTGINADHVASLVQPVAWHRFAMFVGIMDRRQWWYTRIIRFLPLISGLRAMKKTAWYAVPPEYRERFQIEIALNYFCRKRIGRLGFKFLSGINHASKETKYGIFRGFWRRILMGADLALIYFRLYLWPKKEGETKTRSG